MTALDLRLTHALTPSGLPAVCLGEPWLDTYLDFLTSRCRPNSVLATGYDLKAFFTLIAKTPAAVTVADVLGFITTQRAGAGEAGSPVLAVTDDAAKGVSARTVRRRLLSIYGLYSFFLARGDVSADPLPRGLPTRRERDWPRSTRTAGTPLIRPPRTLLGGLRRCEVPRLRMEDLQVGQRQVFIADGKGGRPPTPGPDLQAVLHRLGRLPHPRATRRGRPARTRSRLLRPERTTTRPTALPVWAR